MSVEKNLKVNNVNNEKYLYLLKSIFDLTNMEIKVLSLFISAGKRNNLSLSETYKLFETNVRKKVAEVLGKEVKDINLYIYKLKQKNTIRSRGDKYIFNSIVYNKENVNKLSFNLEWS